MSAEALNVFIIYAREDEPFRAELVKHLLPMSRAGQLRVWTDREIIAGEPWEPLIKKNLKSADIILLLVSSDYFQSDYIHDVEIKEALERHDRGEARVVPVIVRPCVWRSDPTVSRLQVLPTDGVPVNDTRRWPSSEAAWVDVVEGLSNTMTALADERRARASAETHRQADEQRARDAEAREQARRRAEQAAWQQASDAHTVGAYDTYLAQYPRGEYASLARARIKQLRRVATNPAPVKRYATIGGGVLTLLLALWLGGKLFGGKEPEQSVSKPEKSAATQAPDFMAYVPGGTFDMGDVLGDNEYDNEKPVHAVTLASYYLGKTEVTFDEYDAFCAATGREKPSDEGWGRGKRPVVNVSWLDALAYCNWLSERQNLKKVYTIIGEDVTAVWSAEGYRLPTEAEWEYAARQRGQRVRFGNGKDVADPSESIFDGRSAYKKSYSVSGVYRQKTTQVASLGANSLGLYDMSGNVWEWCWDWYGDYSSGAQTNPRGPSTGGFRVLRGGSWINYPVFVRAAYRDYSSPSRLSADSGFRLARAAGG